MADFTEIERRFEEILRSEPVRYSITNEVADASLSSGTPKSQHQKPRILVRQSSKIFDTLPKLGEEIPLHDTNPKFDEADEKKCALNKLLLEAVRYRDVEAIEKLLVSNASPNATCCTEHISACHLAALRPDGALAVLLTHGADKNRNDLFGHTPLHIAAWAGNTRQVAMLLGFPKALINKMSSTTINVVVEQEVKNLSHFLDDVVNAPCAVNVERPEVPKEWADSTIEHHCMDVLKNLPLLPPGSTPLHAACVRAKSQCVRLLLAAGADPNSQDQEGNTPLDVLGSAYYADEYIDRVSFADAVAVLVAERADFNLKNRNLLNTPLHVAVELNSLEAVKTLKNIIPVGRRNQFGLTPLHICIKKKLREIFHVLVYDKLAIENETKLKSAADLRDRSGFTVLHAAIKAGWEQGVCAAIDTGANVFARTNSGDTCLHLAAEVGNVEILNKILNITRKNDIIDRRNSKNETPLIIAVQHGHAECVKRLLDENASPTKTFSSEINVLHIAAEKGNLDILRVLLDRENIRDMLNNLAEDINGFGPIHYAVHNNHPKCVKFLLSRNAYKDLRTSLTGAYTGSTALHLAAIHNNLEIAKILVKNDPYTLKTVNKFDWTPLHTACNYGHRDMIVLLLKEGADLSAIATDRNDKSKITCMDLLMNNLSKPKEFLENFFDTCISTNNIDIQDPNCMITVDYRVLAPTAEGREQIKVLKALVETGDTAEQSRLLLHPLLESFLYLKWKALLPFFYTMIATYSLFVFTLTIYVFSVFLSMDSFGVDELSSDYTLSVMVYFTAFLVVVLEALYVTINTKYFLSLETWVKFGALLLALTLPNAISNLKDGLNEYPRHIATMALLLSWLEMLFLVSRFPNWGYYVLMFGKVLMNVLKILITFSFLVIGFTLSFMLQLHHQSDFDNPWGAFVKILVMMTSELTYSELIDQKINVTKTTDSPPSDSHIVNYITQIVSPVHIFRFLFMTFVILATIVLMNLMVGVAVNDLHNLELLGNIKRLSKQVEFLASLDTLLYNRYFRRYIPKPLEKIILERKTILSIMTLFPSDPKSKFYKSLPSRIRNSIVEKAQLRKEQIENEIGSLSYRKKLDEIYDATIKRKNEKSFDKHDNNIKKRYDCDDNDKHLDNMVKYSTDLDSGIIDSNRQTSDVLNEIKTAILHLEMKMNMMYNEFRNDKLRRELN